MTFWIQIIIIEFQISILGLNTNPILSSCFCFILFCCPRNLIFKSLNYKVWGLIALFSLFPEKYYVIWFLFYFLFIYLFYFLMQPTEFKSKSLSIKNKKNKTQKPYVTVTPSSRLYRNPWCDMFPRYFQACYISWSWRGSFPFNFNLLFNTIYFFKHQECWANHKTRPAKNKLVSIVFRLVTF